MKANSKLNVFLLIPVLFLGFTFSAFPAEKKSKTVGFMWFGKSGMAKRVTKGFDDYMKKTAPDIAIEYVKELADKDAAMKVYKRFQEEKDALVFLRSNGAKLMGKTPPKKPAFIGGCSHPVVLGITDSLEKPSKNATGVTYYLAAERQIKVFKKVFPNLQSVGLIVEKGHPSAQVDNSETTAASKKEGIKFYVRECAAAGEIPDAVKALVEKKADIIIIGNQALIIDNAAMVAKNAGSVPVVSYAEKPIKKGSALCGLVPDDEKLGRMLADSLIQVIKDGKKVKDIPIKTDPAPKFVINIPMMKKMGVKIPGHLLKYAKKIQ